MRSKLKFETCIMSFKQDSRITTIIQFISNRKTAATLAILVCVFYFLQQKASWVGLKVSGVRGAPNFIDQESVLNSARCFKNIGIEVYKSNASPSSCGGYVYSIELLRILNFFHLSSISSEVLGTIFMWLTIAALCGLLFTIKNFEKFDAFFVLLALISPGIWLLLERGNYDEVIFLIVLLSSYLITTKYQDVGMVLLAVTVLMKFYTLPAYLVAILYLKHRYAKILFGSIAIPITIYILFLIKHITVFPSTWFISFGLDSLGLYANLYLKERISENAGLPGVVITGIGVGVIAIFVLYLTRINLNPKIKIRSSLLTDRVSTIYIMVLTVFLACFFAGMNYDYRLIFLSTLLIVSRSIFLQNGFKRVLTISGCTALSLSTLGFGFGKIPSLIIQFIGDVSIYIFVSTQLLYLHKVYFEPLRAGWLRLLGSIRSRLITKLE